MFEREVGKHVRNMEHPVVMYKEIIGKSRTEERGEHPEEHLEQKKNIEKTVRIEDLFRPRSLKAGAAESDVRKVLLYGNPGSGKTCIGKVIAHKWARKEMMQEEFTAIYVVPMRRLNVAKAKGTREEALEEVIAHTCFKQKESDVEFEELKTQVSDDLHMSSTLLIFDGLDEANDLARERISVAEERSCKLLMLTRPYNLREMHERVDIQFECLGFNDDQLRNFIKKELREDEALELTESLFENRAIWEMAHIPVAAHILCSISKRRRIAIGDMRKKATMFRICDHMANFLWKRFANKPQSDTIDKTIFFNDLEKIAFEALRSGHLLIEEELVESYARQTSKLMRESGFLVCALEDNEYQFSHKTFQEFFAGRYIAKCLQEESWRNKRQVESFIQRGKYIERYALTISFAMHALTKACKEDALKDMFSVLDEQPVELLGVQHLFAKMRVLEACLGEAGENDLGVLLRHEEALQLIESVCELSKKTIDDALLRQIVIEKFKQCSNVLEQFPEAFNDTVKEVKELLASGRDLKYEEKAKIRDVLTLAERFPVHNTDINEWHLKLTNEDKDRSCAMDGMKRVVIIASKASGLLQDLMSLLEREWSNEGSNVHEKAKAIGKVLKLQSHELDDLSVMMKSRCIVRDFCVLPNVMETIGCIIEAIPQIASDLLLTLEIGCSDEDSNVCETARRILKSIKPERIILPTIAPRCVYKSGLVLLFTLNAFTVEPSGKSEKATFFVHTTFPQEIGEWDRKDLEEYVKHLREEFGRKFPELLDYLGTKEGTTRSKQPRKKKARGLLRFIAPCYAP